MIFKRHKHIDPRREWIRQNLPSGREGFSFEDLDGVVSIFPHNGHARERMRLLVEHKWNVTQLDYSQQVNFREIHKALRRGDPTYVGFYLVTFPGISRSETDDEYVIDFYRNPRINSEEITWDELRRFYLGELRFVSLFEK